MKDSTVNKIMSGKTDKVSHWADVLWSRKSHETLFTIIFKNRYVFYSLSSQTDRQNIYRIVAYVWEKCS